MALSPFNLKSSVLCPETRHITSQYLALEQIEAHHKMVSHAKGNIDMASPKSMQSYIYNVDKRKKYLWPQDHLLRPLSGALSGNANKMQQRKDNFEDENKVEEDRETMNASISLNKNIQASVPSPSFNGKVADKISWYLEAVNQDGFRIVTSNRQSSRNGDIHHYGSQISLSSSLRTSKVIKGDIIEWHKDQFTSSHNQFSPRILANNFTKSKIRGMRCYNPPQRKENIHSEDSSNTFESSSPDDDDDSEDIEVKNEVEKESIKNDQISIKDAGVNHQNWLSEQAVRAQLRHKFGTKFKHFPYSSTAVKNDASEHNVQYYSANSVHLFNSNEDTRYLKFLNDVTEDILRSGVYSDRAILQTFEFHLQFCSENNDKEKLKKLFDQMLESLRISNDEPENFFNQESVIGARKNIISGTPPEKEDVDCKVEQLKSHDISLFNSLEPNSHDRVFSFSTDAVHLETEGTTNSKQTTSVKTEHEES